jgi:hypothetical protein
MRAPRGLALLFVAAVAGCSVERLPPPESPPPSATATVSVPPPTASPAATSDLPIEADGEPVDVDPDIRAASLTRAGVRVVIEVDRNPLPAGEPTWVTTTLINRGPGVLRWMTDACETHVHVGGQMSGVRWAAGSPQEGAARTFKSWASQTVVELSGPITLSFVPERWVGRRIDGCADIGITHELGVGGRVAARYQWDGFSGDFGLPPSGPAELVATFDYWWREGQPEGSGPPVTARLPVLVEGGRDPEAGSPGQVIDVALSVPEFLALLEAHPSLQEWDMPIRVEFDPNTDAWEVELRILGGGAATVTIGTFGDVRDVEVRR